MVTLSSIVRGGIVLGALALLGTGCPQKASPPDAVYPEDTSEALQEVASPGSLLEDVPSVIQAGVAITADGFSPDTLEIPPGTSVTFTNTDTKPHRVASDPHPQHTGLPGFDAGTPIPSGESFSFVFEKAGTFAYHDHPNPAVHGKIVVK